MKSESAPDIIPCSLSAETKQRIEDFARAIEEGAHALGGHGMEREEFERSGLLRAAIERLRGRQAASMEEKRRFIADKLDALKAAGRIAEWRFSGGGDRHDYEVRMPDGRVCVIEAKGCLDGNNTNIFERPPHADEFYIWSLCQNPGADPRHNIWSGIHTRLGAETIHRRVQVDALIVWDMLCGSAGRPCPKLPNGRGEPPPCLYLFPRHAADPRHNPSPPPGTLEALALASAMFDVFGKDERGLYQVRLETKYEGNALMRRTTLIRDGAEARRSRWTEIRRANR